VPKPGRLSSSMTSSTCSALVIRGNDGHAARLRQFLPASRHPAVRRSATATRPHPLPFHALTWNTDGELKQLTCAWDFGDAPADAFALTPVKLGRWGGFVFVNFDPDSAAAGGLPGGAARAFPRWPMEDRFTAAHVVKHLDCNWKVTVEAFIETFHVIGLHSESLPFFGDVNSQYDVWSGKRHISRMINPSGVPARILRQNDAGADDRRGGQVRPVRRRAAGARRNAARPDRRPAARLLRHDVRGRSEPSQRQRGARRHRIQPVPQPYRVRRLRLAAGLSLAARRRRSEQVDLRGLAVAALSAEGTSRRHRRRAPWPPTSISATCRS
jgi:phenylpropionate dioxygenase-like ring-hydroxylating dioxygenase large terminal subunit